MRQPFFGFLTVLLLIAVCLAGCGGGGGGGGGTTATLVNATGETGEISGLVTFSGVPMESAAVYLIKPQTAFETGVAQAGNTIMGSIRTGVAYNSAYGEYRTMSDSQGRYHFAGVAVGNYTLVAIKDAAHQTVKTDVTVSAAITTVDVQLTPTGNIKGSVAISGVTDLSSVLVYLEGTSYVAITSAQGAFTFFNIPAGSYKLIARRNAFVTTTPATVTVQPAIDNQVSTLTLVAESVSPTTGEIVGTVTRLDTVPGGATVHLAGTMYVTTADGTGNYRFAGIPAGTFQVTFPSEFYTPNLTPSVTVTAGQSVTAPAVTLTPRQTTVPTGGFTGRVVKTLLLSNGETNMITLRLASGTLDYITVSDAQGNFGFHRLPLGQYTLSALDDRYGLASGPTTPVTIATPATSDIFHLVVKNPSLVPVRCVGAVTKSLKFRDTFETEQVTVRLATAGREIMTVTDNAGNFVFENVPAGFYRFEVTDQDYVLASGVTFVNLINPLNTIGAFLLNPAVAPPPQVANLLLSAGQTHIAASWDAVAGVSYVIECLNIPNSTVKRFEITENGLKINELAPNANHRVRVWTKKKNFLSPAFAEQTIITKPAIVMPRRIATTIPGSYESISLAKVRNGVFAAIYSSSDPVIPDRLFLRLPDGTVHSRDLPNWMADLEIGNSTIYVKDDFLTPEGLRAYDFNLNELPNSPFQPVFPAGVSDFAFAVHPLNNDIYFFPSNYDGSPMVYDFDVPVRAANLAPKTIFPGALALNESEMEFLAAFSPDGSKLAIIKGNSGFDELRFYAPGNMALLASSTPLTMSSLFSPRFQGLDNSSFLLSSTEPKYYRFDNELVFSDPSNAPMSPPRENLIDFPISVADSHFTIDAKGRVYLITAAAPVKALRQYESNGQLKDKTIYPADLEMNYTSSVSYDPIRREVWAGGRNTSTNNYDFLIIDASE